MKKLFAIVLTLALVLALGTTTFAATLNAVGDTDTAVTATVNATAAAEVISVDVTWGTLGFTYNSTETWNPDTHTTTTNGAWALTDTFQNVATVTNHSNVAVTAAIAFEEADGTSYTATFDKTGAQNLATAVGTAVNAAPTVTFGMRVAGTGASGAAPANNAELGTITITIAKQ